MAVHHDVFCGTNSLKLKRAMNPLGAEALLPRVYVRHCVPERGYKVSEVRVPERGYKVSDVSPLETGLIGWGVCGAPYPSTGVQGDVTSLETRLQ